jgi:hypothetical protein
LVIYSVLSRSKIIDKKLMNENCWDSNYTKYVFFKETDSDIRLGTLYSNNAKNMEEKFKILKNTNANN